ncbi:MAG: hypothetical protein PWR08_1369 [Thermoanaerobacterium sp.]|nr:hypothetical protein [Thermoanaerobacterium sp.]
MVPILTELKYKYNLKDQELANKIGISRSQLYRIKTEGKIGEKSIKGLKNAFPEIDIDEFLKQVGGTLK